MILVEAMKDGVQQVNLDYQGLEITAIIDSDHNDLMANSKLFENLNPNLGGALAILLNEPLNTGDKAEINITYETTSE